MQEQGRDFLSLRISHPNSSVIPFPIATAFPQPAPGLWVYATLLEQPVFERGARALTCKALGAVRSVTHMFRSPLEHMTLGFALEAHKLSRLRINAQRLDSFAVPFSKVFAELRISQACGHVRDPVVALA